MKIQLQFFSALLIFFGTIYSYSQTIGQEFMVNGEVNNGSTYSGSGTGCSPCGGWTQQVNFNYAPTSASNGSCHTEDRMWKSYINGDAIVSQVINDIPPGVYNFSFWTKWSNGLPTYDNGAGQYSDPKFTIKILQPDQTYVNDVELVISEPTAIHTWVQQTGTWTNTTTSTIKLQWFKNGSAGDGTKLNKNMYVDTVSLTYQSALSLDDLDNKLNVNFLVDQNNHLKVYADHTNIKGSQVTVYDITGRSVISVNNFSPDATFSLDNLEKGIYIVKLDTDTTTVTAKIVR